MIKHTSLILTVIVHKSANQNSHTQYSAIVFTPSEKSSKLVQIMKKKKQSLY